eukprot:TRINITY_DN1480_c0_g1_i1.p1 TRINITY_DN1480_c0_g1~~TRINITY_DN1480_c0_g1_i1.p1  ORF type:complete len:498 (-),score=134.04 TRINITY_DN1480_c0_g1_i1:132-1625(-)
MENRENSRASSRIVRYLCVSCKDYISSETYVTSHLDHNVVDLAENSARFLAKYQGLARTASLLSDRRQLYIKDESIDGILAHIRRQVFDARASLQADVAKTVEDAAKNLVESPLVKEMERVKTELAVKDDEELTKVKNELNKFCKDLLLEITESRFEKADKMIHSSKLEEYEKTLNRLSEKAEGDVDFIREIRSLRHTKVGYCYNPLEVLGMIRVTSHVTKPSRVVQFDRAHNLVRSFNPKTKKLEVASVLAGFILPFRFVAIEAQNNIYLNGGDNDHGVYLNSHYLYDELRGGLVASASMNQARSRHALASVHNKIYAIGGECENKVLSHCECYDIKENCWVAVKKLREARCGLSACSLKTNVYAIGGWDKDYLGTIEELNTAEESKGWRTVKVNTEAALKPVQAVGAVGIKDDEILIFGGYLENEVLTTKCYSFHVTDSKIVKKREMESEDAFIASEVRKIDNTVYAFGYAKGGIHSYDIVTGNWHFTPQSSLLE